MLLGKKELAQYGQEISELYEIWLNETFSGLTPFGIFSGSILQAVGSIKNYMGSWYLRGDVVKPEFRGQGLQRQLIKERLEFLALKTDLARISVFPDNNYSIRNIEATGFTFEKRKKLGSGETVLVYQIRLRE